MLKKRHIVTTSAIISIILSNTSFVQAEEQSILELHSNEPQETEVVEEKQTELQRDEQDLENPEPENLPSEKPEENLNDSQPSMISPEENEARDSEDIENEETVQTFSAIAAVEVPSADEIYNQIMNSGSVSQIWNLTNEFKNTYPDDSRLTEVVNYAGRANLNYAIKLHDRGDYTNAIQYYNRVTSSSKIDNSIQSEANAYQSQANSNLERITGTDYYEQITTSKTVSQAWNLAQQFKRDFPHDTQLSAALNHAAALNLNYAKKLHNQNDLDNAIYYYNRVLSVSEISEDLKNEASIYNRQANEGMVLTTPSEYSEKIFAESSITRAWRLSLQFKTDFPQDSNLASALNYVAELNLNYGMKLHEGTDFSNALLYYNRVLDESSVNPSFRKLAEMYSRQANNNIELTTEEDYYEEILSEGSITTAWGLVQQFERYFPNNKFLEEAINYVAELNLNYGKKLHDQGNYSDALLYYNRVLEASSVQNSVNSQAVVYHRQASNNKDLTLAKDYYDLILSSGSVSGAWNLAKEYQLDYPNDSNLGAAINHAAELNLNYAIRMHTQKDYSTAAWYYNRVLDNTVVSPTIKSYAKTYLKQAQANRQLSTAKDYYDQILASGSVSDAWNLATQFSEDFPHDPLLNAALNHAAELNLNYAIRLHKQGRFIDASFYYNRILNTESINSTIFDQAKLFRGLANNKRKLRTVDGYYNAMKNSGRVSESWSLAQEAMAVYPDNSKLINGLNKVANQNIQYARKIQNQGNATGARPYYVRVINNSNIKASIRHLAEIFLNQTYSNHQPLVYLDVGHGGSDTGAYHYGVAESTLNMRVSNYLRNELEARGYKVMMSRNSNVFVGLSNRPYEANDLEADIFVSVHHNSMGGSGIARGIETFIHHTVSSGFGQEERRSEWQMDDPRISESVKLADAIHDNLIKDTGLYNRGVKGNNYNVIRNSYIPAVLLELGFMDNYNELSVITRDSYQRTAAKSIANGIDNYYKTIN